jgi:hypothetical protein
MNCMTRKTSPGRPSTWADPQPRIRFECPWRSVHCAKK